MKKLSRSTTKKALFFLAVSMVALIIALIKISSVIVWVITWISIIVCVYYMTKATKCPYCGAYFRGVNLNKPDAGYCRRCGKLLEYDE